MSILKAIEIIYRPYSGGVKFRDLETGRDISRSRLSELARAENIKIKFVEPERTF